MISYCQLDRLRISWLPCDHPHVSYLDHFPVVIRLAVWEMVDSLRTGALKSSMSDTYVHMFVRIERI